jgi:chloramphenicol-sensitive protein RarD
MTDLTQTPAATPTNADRRGLGACIVAFSIWGLLPLYLRPLRAVPALEVMSHRVVWGCLLVCSWLWARGNLGDIVRALAAPATRWRLLLSAVLVSCNWLGFIYAASVGRVVDASLGYFINPLINVLLGVLLLSERLSPLRWCSVGLAALGVLWLAVAAGHPPWLALLLAFSFAGYGLIRKLVAVEAVVGLAAETLMLVPLAAGYLAWAELTRGGVLGAGEAFPIAWLLLGGLVTALPLALFAFGARRIPLSTVGLIQYLAPTLQFACGVFLFGEPFDRTRLVGFALIWSALALFAAETLQQQRAS